MLRLWKSLSLHFICYLSEIQRLDRPILDGVSYLYHT